MTPLALLPRAIVFVRLLPLALLAPTSLVLGQSAPPVPDWALPGSATHQQVPPPAGFTRPTTVIAVPLGVFEGQAEVGTPLVPGAALFDPATGRYTIRSAGYNIWYFRDEFRFLWRRMSGDVSFAASVTFPVSQGYDDRKVVLILRQDLDDNAQEIMVALHGTGMIHLASRDAKGADLREVARDPGRGRVGATEPVRLGIEKRGDRFTLFTRGPDGTLHRVGEPFQLPLATPFYVGLGFTSHLPATVDTAAVTDVVLENAAGAVR